MSHYQSNLRDLYFNLFEVFGADQVLGSAAYPDLDVDSARSILAEMDHWPARTWPRATPTATATRRSSTRRRTA